MTAIEIIRGALEICGIVSANEPVSDEDANLCLGVLNRILKLMPTYGFSWPKVSSSDASVTWNIGTPSTVTPPADYFGMAVLDYTDANGKRVTLSELTKPQYDAITDLTATSTYPTHFYIAPDTTFKLLPIPTQDPVLKLAYQSIVADVTLVQTPSLSISMQDLIEYWLADEVSVKFQVPQNDRIEISKRLVSKREHAMQWAVSTAPIVFEVAD